MSETKDESSRPRTVVVAGSQSISAKGVFERYASLPNTTVYGLSRRPGESSANAKHISVDLLDPQDVQVLCRNSAICYSLFLRRGLESNETEV